LDHAKSSTESILYLEISHWFRVMLEENMPSLHNVTEVELDSALHRCKNQEANVFEVLFSSYYIIRHMFMKTKDCYKYFQHHCPTSCAK